MIAALPLGGRIKMDPWSDDLEMLKSKPVGAVAEREKMPFEVTPFILYLTRDAMRRTSQNNAGRGLGGIADGDGCASSDPRPTAAKSNSRTSLLEPAAETRDRSGFGRRFFS